MPISLLDARTAKLIGSSVVITSVYSVIKELLENAVDAESTSINISLERYGLNRIEVRDNGSGICHEDIPLACLAGHTSKIKDFSDLDQLHSYGFRGQALNALCAVADLSFTTRTSDDDVATTYNLDKEGRITSSGPSYLSIGTTVIVKNLFVNLPVRRKMLSRSPSSLRTILWLLRSFSIAKPKLALSLVHDGSLVWRKCTAPALPSAVQEALGYKLAVMLHQMYWKGSYQDSAVLSEEEICEDVEVEMDILVPKKGSSISEFCSTQTVEGIVLNEYLIVNGRPVKHKKMEKVMTTCIGKGLASDFPNRKKPPWVLRLNIPPRQLDVNLESDKTKVYLRCEGVILRTLEERVLNYYGIQVTITDSSSQPLETKPPKKKVETPKQASEPYHAFSSNSPLLFSPNSGKINDSASESDHNLSPLPPPSKQARIEGKELDTRSFSADLKYGNKDPTKSSQPVFSLEPFEISDSQMSEIEPPENLECNENVLDVGSLKLCAKEMSVGSFRIEVLRKSEDTAAEKANLGNAGTGADEISCVDSSKSPKRVEGSPKEKDNEGNEMDDGDMGVIMEALESLENAEHASELDLDAWSRGKINANGVPIEEPVKILNSKPNHQLTSENASAPKLITNKQVPNAPFKMLSKTAMDGNSSTSHLSSEFGGQIPQISPVASPLPNACSQLGRRDMRGFDCFASKMRPKILAEQPGILFTNVASELAKHWEALSDVERDEFKKEGIAKAAARQKNANSGIAMESLLPKKTSQKLPVILNDKFKQDTLLKKVVKVKQEAPCIPDCGRTMNVSIIEVRQKFTKRDKAASQEQHEKEVDERIILIGQLKPSGVWIYKKGIDIGILRHFALQELVVYQKLMNNLSLPILPLQVPIVFDERAIGSVLWRKFLSLESHYDAIKQQTEITSELIAKNGFQISLLPGNGESDSSALITGIASVISPYGVDDLKEVLEIIDSADGELSKCRTLQISTYIESEATRMCRQSSPVMPKDDVLSLLAQWNGRPKCLHSQPVFVPFEFVAQQNEFLTNGQLNDDSFS